ncbi:MAG: tetratricopeptide repeat protein, partial [Verrucomicrobiota bacterium]
PSIKVSVPIPPNMDKLDPYLRAYILTKARPVVKRPRDFDLQSELGLVYAANGLWIEARAAFENAVRLKPEEPLAHLYVAIATQELDGFAAAIPLYRDLTVRFPQFPQGHYRLGDVALRMGDVPVAEKAYEQLITLAPEEWRAYTGLADVRIRQGRFQEAVELLNKALQIDPAAKIAHHLLGLAYRGLGRHEAAEQALKRGLKAEHYPMPDPWADRAPEHMKLLPELLALGRNYLASGQAAKAVATLEPALRWHPGDLRLMLLLANACNEAEEQSKARALLLRVLEIQSTNHAALVALSTSCLDLGETNEALAYTERAVALAPADPKPHLARATVLRALQRFPEALLSFEQAFQLDPENAYIPMEMGDLYLRHLGQTNEALRAFLRADRIDPELFLVKIRLADVYLRLRQTNESHVAIDAARRLNPGEPVLGVLEERYQRLLGPASP